MTRDDPTPRVVTWARGVDVSALTVDALVAATATTPPRPVVVLTSGVDDLTTMLDGTGVEVHRL